MKLPKTDIINLMVEEYSNMLVNRFANANINIDDAEEDYRRGLIDMMNLIKSLNEEKTNLGRQT